MPVDKALGFEIVINMAFKLYLQACEVDKKAAHI